MCNNSIIDSPLPQESHIFGPPGCGKTSRITQLAQDACAEHGPSKVKVVSFTRAAKKAFNFESCSYEPEVSTLHSMCYHLLGKPAIAEAEAEEFSKSYPGYALGIDANPDNGCQTTDEEISRRPGDRLYAQRERLLATCVDRTEWPSSVREFDQAWTDFKDAKGLMDFADLIDRAGTDFTSFAGDPRVVFIDEAQDLSRAEIRLVRKLCAQTDQCIFALDDDQTIYGFKGSSPQDLVNAVPDDRVEILDQSYRVPGAVHARAEKWIRKVRVRQPKAYKPRTEQGTIARCQATYREPEPMLKGLEGHLDADMTVMILGSCGYMLENVIAVLGKRGVPFCNSYRPDRFEWNPLKLPRGRTSDADRIRALMRGAPLPSGTGDPQWTPEELKLFLGVLGQWVLKDTPDTSLLPPEVQARCSGSGKPDGRRVLDCLEAGVPVKLEVLKAILKDSHLTALLSDTRLDWFTRNLRPYEKKRVTMKSSLKICEARSPDALEAQPRLTVGTIHSVKGGEADVVYLFPDLSSAGRDNWTGTRQMQDSVRRLFYVAMTRAKDTMVICEPVKARFSVDGL